MRVLLVDDDELVRSLTAYQLASAGHEVVEAGDGLEGLSRVESGKFGAVVCDWDMPRMDGLTLCRTIRSGPLGLSPYFILLTGNESPVAQAEGYDAGADAFLVKPCTPEALFAAVRTAELLTK